MKSFKQEVIADHTNTWVGNGLRFATREEAEDYGLDLASRWFAVRQSRAVESEDPVTHAWRDGRLFNLADGDTIGYKPPKRITL